MSYNEESKHWCNEPNCQSYGEDKIATHQLSDYFWMCDRCYQARMSAWRNTHTLLRWNNIDEINSLDEAMNYFAYINKGRKYGAFEKLKTIDGAKGAICHVIAVRVDDQDPFHNYWPKYYYYLVCYNREYLAGHQACSFFERVPQTYSTVPWQSFHSKILDEALGYVKSSHGVRIVVIMKSKRVLYCNPQILEKWSYEYETEHQLPREIDQTCSIPITKLEESDQFFIHE